MNAQKTTIVCNGCDRMKPCEIMTYSEEVDAWAKAGASTTFVCPATYHDGKVRLKQGTIQSIEEVSL